MDPSTSNTLRTLGIIATCVVIGISSLVLLLFAICGALFILPNDRHNPQNAHLVYAAFAVAVVLIVIGVVIVSILARGMIRNPVPRAPLNMPAPTIAAPVSIAPSQSPGPAVALDPTQLSPASRAALRQLIYSVAAYIGVILLSGVATFAIPAMRATPGRTSQVFAAAIVYRLMTGAPYAVLLYALDKSPGPRAFAYSLVLPGVALMGAVFTVPVFFIGVSRLSVDALPAALSLLFLCVPAILNAAIVYFGWMAIQRTGLHPPPKRFILATLVILFYDSMSGISGAGLAMSLLQQSTRR